ncbi:hypothetical protein TrispH2_008565 [Trichoplax sp. H2]|uniref:Uncharacterized protein n=1 Tax=Trichoplax adhaerens TaxID=10228 RepID=B3S2B6_TRIAD|nr:predicted protein [Trichoplax adhaerens]EDV23618.1 predicted protein [Trichoplax adhaerens]RDD38381.1 hypothetical protein TrispH2_008565 [Trichoplax sp. H2]|eukprot:XP_002114528.1 predicted protein [Trichoplax adhaerens]
MSVRSSLTLKNMPVSVVRSRSEYSDEILSMNSLYDRQLQKQLEKYDKNTQALKKKMAKEKASLLRSVKAVAAIAGTSQDKSSAMMRPRSQSMVVANSNVTCAKYSSRRGSNSNYASNPDIVNHAIADRTTSDPSLNNEEEAKVRPRSNSTGRSRQRLHSLGKGIPRSSSLNQSLNRRETSSPNQKETTSPTAKETTTTVTVTDTNNKIINSQVNHLTAEMDEKFLLARPRSSTIGSEVSREKKVRDIHYIRRKSAEKLYGMKNNPAIHEIVSDPDKSKRYFRRSSYAQGEQRAKLALPFMAVRTTAENSKMHLPQIKTP